MNWCVVRGARCVVRGAWYVVRGAWCVGILLGSPLAAQTSLSIYRDGRVVVRRTLPQALQQGRNTLTLRLEALDPATLFSTDTSVSITSATVRYPSTSGDALSRAIGQTLSFVRSKGDTIRATVLRADPPQYKLPDGRVLLSPPGEPLFPAELVRTTSEAELVLDAGRARQRTDIAYVAEGMTWEALYQVIVTGARGQVSGTATVTSRSLRADSADVQLVAGAIRQTRQPKADMVAAPQAQMRLEAVTVGGVDQTSEQSVGETHVYQLPGRLTIEPGVPVATALFPRSSAPVTQELIVPGVLPWRGWIGQTPEPNRVPVQVWYTIKRASKTPFGDRPLPAGTVQLYQADSSGRVQLIGEAANDHTAPGRDLRVQSGDAFDITAERVQTDYNQEQLPPPRRGMPSGQRVTAAYRVTITNAKAEAVTVDVRESRFGKWTIVTSSVPPEKLSSTESRFRVQVPAGGEATLTYTVQIET
ncbi:MAG TPA: hypothetical protein VG454_01190 [Gemmatimonadales bacterium]|nr:hypothetical protein [Gemmatimonadales bacterium]